MKTEQVLLSQVKVNEANPRTIKEHKLRLLMERLIVFPKMIKLRPVVVDNAMVALGGNMRIKALNGISELSLDEIGAIAAKTKNFQRLTKAEQTALLEHWQNWLDRPTVEIARASELSDAEKQEFIIADNASFGEWDYDALANNWDAEDLGNWGVDVWNPEKDGGNWGGGGESDGFGEDTPNDGDDSAADSNPPRERIPEAEELLNAAMQENAQEYIKQFDLLFSKGWVMSGMTLGFAKACFLQAKYYGRRYPRYLSLYFTPEQVKTSANVRSVYDQLKITAAEGKAGIAGLRTRSGDGQLNEILKSSYPFGGARAPMDFPVETERSLVEEFAGGGDVLDPCHGWGGRLVGTLLAGARSYTGVDPSPEAHRGVTRIKDAYLPYCAGSTKSVTLIEDKFEACALADNSFDFALTSPPYFDVEQYHGDNQAHVCYPEYDLWREKFYRPLIERTHRFLRPGGVFALQVGGQSYPLIEDGISIAKTVGFSVEQRVPEGLLVDSSLHGTEEAKRETLLILRK